MPKTTSSNVVLEHDYVPVVRNFVLAKSKESLQQQFLFQYRALPIDHHGIQSEKTFGILIETTRFNAFLMTRQSFVSTLTIEDGGYFHISGSSHFKKGPL